MTREEVTHLAQWARDRIAQEKRAGEIEYVVCVTDESGQFVGVCANVSDERTDAILFSALYGGERVHYPEKAGT